MSINLEMAMAMPQANYLVREQVDNPKLSEQLVSAGFESAVIVDNQPKAQGFSYACTKSILYTCLGIVVENKTTGITALAHLRGHTAEGLQKLFELTSKGGDALEVHLIGANVPINGCTLVEGAAKWLAEMQKILDVVNLRDNTVLSTFDVGNKPHPATFAVVKVNGATEFIRGTRDVTSNEEAMEFMDREYTEECPFRYVAAPRLETGNRRNAIFFDLTYDVTDQVLEGQSKGRGHSR